MTTILYMIFIIFLLPLQQNEKIFIFLRAYQKIGSFIMQNFAMFITIKFFRNCNKALAGSRNRAI